MPPASTNRVGAVTASELCTVVSSLSGGSGDVRNSSDGGAAAVGGDDRTGDVAGLRRGQEDDHISDLFGLGGPADDGGVANAGGDLGGLDAGIDRARGHGVDADARRA